MKLFRRRTVADPRSVEFCESCGEVCDSTCRSQARIDQIRTRVAYQSLRLP